MKTPRLMFRAIGLLTPITFSGLTLAQTEPEGEAPVADTPAESQEPEPTAESPEASETREPSDTSEEAAAEAAEEKDETSAKPALEKSSDSKLDEDRAPDADQASDAGTPPVQAEIATEELDEEISDAELNRYLEEAQLGDTGFDPHLEVYGFADFNYTHYISKNNDPWRVLYNNKGHFGVGNLNVYLDGKISETVRSLAEIRFTYLPHGNVEQLGAPTTRVDNSSTDYTRNERDIALGGLRIERAWLQWSPHQVFRVKAGHWLTPYGIWNVDHGTPTIVSVTRPFMIDEQLLPESQAGLLVEGRFDLTDHFALEYAAGLSNGRGPIFQYYDFDENKGITGLLKLLYTGAGELQVGASAYKGQFTAADITLDVNTTDLSSRDVITYQFDEVAYGVDVRYTNGGFLFQSEAIVNDQVFTDEGRGSVTGGLTADIRRWGVYGLGGYRFDWFGVMPYVIGEYAPVPNAGIRELPREVLLVGGGLNIRPLGQVVVKVGYDQAVFPEERDLSLDKPHPKNARAGRMGILMNRRELIVGAAGLGVSTLVTPAEAGGLVVVVHKSISQTSFSKKSELNAIFTTRKRNFDGGKRIIPLNLPPRNTSRVEFDQRVLGMSPDQVARYWIDRKVRGGNSPPRHVPSAALIARLVAKLPGSISYVPESLASGLKVVARL